MGRRTDSANDAATVNGRPFLAATDVRCWVREVCHKAPSERDKIFNLAADELAAKINEFDLLSALWYDSPEHREWRKANYSRNRMRRIGEALAQLKVDLSEMLTDAQKVGLVESEDTIDVRRIIAFAERTRPQFEKYKNRPGAKRKGWHVVAKDLRPLIVQVLKLSGKSRVGFGKPTSPGVKLMRLALARLRVRVSLGSITQALRSKRKRVAKRKP